VLPRITSALVKFITPIQTSIETQSFTQTKILAGQKKNKEKDKDQANKEKTEQHAKTLRLVKVEPEAKRSLSTTTSQDITSMGSEIRNQRALIVQWMGRKVYQSKSLSQAGVGAIPKGSILDELIA
jgi:hypothetical protein